jgi:hypothetical protein
VLQSKVLKRLPSVFNDGSLAFQESRQSLIADWSFDFKRKSDMFVENHTNPVEANETEDELKIPLSRSASVRLRFKVAVY